MEQGDVVILHASCSDTELKIEAEIERAKPAFQDDQNEEPLPVFYVERSDLLRLNDSLYASSYQQALVETLASVQETSDGSDDGEGDSVEILLLDMCEGFSLFGLAAAKLGIFSPVCVHII